MKEISQKALLLVLLTVLLFTVGCFKQGQRVTQPPISISVSSASTALGLGQAAAISAIVYDQSNQGVTWTVSPLNFGSLSQQSFDSSTLTATVTYTAPTYVASPTAVTVTATSITNPLISSTISFHFSPIIVSLSYAFPPLPVSTQTISPGQQIPLLVNVSNDQSNSGVTWSVAPATAGSLTTEGPNTALYSAPSSVSGLTNVVITATSVKDPTVSANVQATILPTGAGPNVVMLNVNGGPIPGVVYPNGAFTSVTVCNPASSAACQTIGGVLVDTGSYGLRILQTQIPLLKLPTITDALGDTLENCAPWHDGTFLWGPVSIADVYIGGESASTLTGTSVPVQVISSGLGIVVPAGCSNGGTLANTAQLLGVNAILGIGPEPTDCTVSGGVNLCDGTQTSAPPSIYYSCPTIGCTTSSSPVLVPALQQVANPIPFFNSDRNGVILQLPSVSSPQASAVGMMIFGIGTELNNSLGSQTIFTLDANDYFSTTLNGQTFTHSTLDSGSPAILFSSSMPTCQLYPNYYCPSSTSSFSATNIGATQGQATVNFSVGDADSLLSGNAVDAVFDNLAGPVGTSTTCDGNSSCVFDWGLPFFYGRTVFVAIDGQTAPSGAPAPPWWAY